jgi:ABC-2 type transport system ATP-binding protein
VGLAGRNGSGKSVLLRCVLGLMIPESGEVWVNGKRVGKEVEFAPDTGFIIGRPGFIPSCSGYRNLKYLAELKGRASQERLRSIMAQVGLDPDCPKHVNRYSTGMVQRLGIAQALMEDPALLLLDEPFNGLDEEGVRDMRALLLRQKAEGKTILMTTHNPEDLQILCDAAYRMDAGMLSGLA